MHGFAASLLEQIRVAEPWTGHCDLCTAKDHMMTKLIDTMYMREQINLYWMITEMKKKGVNPTARTFMPPVQSFEPTENSEDIDTNA